MVKLVKSPYLGSKIRSEGWDEIGISTWIKIRDAIEQGRKEEALDLVDYLAVEGLTIHRVMPAWVYYLLDYIAKNYGEEKIFETLLESGKLMRLANIRGAARLPVEERVRVNVQNQRAHRCGPGELGNVAVAEFKDKYVISMDPCGSGGSMRRASNNGGSLTAAPYNFGKTKKAYPWSWSKANVAYYCTHCCVWSEVMPIDEIGYPLRVCLYEEDPDKPCTWVFYKKPNLIPDEYFSRVGKIKDLARIHQINGSQFGTSFKP